MDLVNMLEAKSSLSRLVEAVETGKQAEIVIARNGRPAARLVPIESPGAAGARIGVARGLFVAPDAHSDDDKDIAALFNGTAD
jgi:prevent-host-death family protein